MCIIVLHLTVSFSSVAVVVAAVLVVPGAIHATTTADMTVDMIEAAMIAMTTGTTTDHTGNTPSFSWYFTDCH